MINTDDIVSIDIDFDTIIIVLRNDNTRRFQFRNDDWAEDAYNSIRDEITNLNR